MAVNMEIEGSEQEIKDKDGETFVIDGEDHTLGNSVRYMLSKSENVDFCGYNVPHPSKDQVFLRVQTCNGVTAKEAVLEATGNLRDVCNHIKEKFEAAV